MELENLPSGPQPQMGFPSAPLGNNARLDAAAIHENVGASSDEAPYALGTSRRSRRQGKKHVLPALQLFLIVALWAGFLAFAILRGQDLSTPSNVRLRQDGESGSSVGSASETHSGSTRSVEGSEDNKTHTSSSTSDIHILERDAEPSVKSDEASPYVEKQAEVPGRTQIRANPVDDIFSSPSAIETSRPAQQQQHAEFRTDPDTNGQTLTLPQYPMGVDTTPIDIALPYIEKHKDVPGPPKVSSVRVAEASSSPQVVSVLSLPRPMRVVYKATSKWCLPGVEEAEAAMPLLAKKGKNFIARITESLDAKGSAMSPKVNKVLRDLAGRVSRGTRFQLVGMEIRLTNMTSLVSTTERTSGVFRVTQYLGEGSSNIVVEAIDVETQEVFAMRILYAYLRGGLRGRELLASCQAAVSMESAVMKDACGNTPPSLAASHRGIAVPLYTAKIGGLPKLIPSERVYIYTEVMLMERLHHDLNTIAFTRWIPMEAKEYIARRLLLEVLHLQEARVSHNDIKWSNCFMRVDGSFLLGDFGSSTKFGEPLQAQFTDVTPAYGEPELLIDLSRAPQKGALVLPNPKSDMWTLGVLLYELFSDGKLPYGLNSTRHSFKDMSSRSNVLISGDVRPSKLLKNMERLKIPIRWRRLMYQLLELRRSRRISAQQVAKDFRDLYFVTDKE